MAFAYMPAALSQAGPLCTFQACLELMVHVNVYCVVCLLGCVFSWLTGTPLSCRLYVRW